MTGDNKPYSPARANDVGWCPATSIVVSGTGESAHLDVPCFVAVERWRGLTGNFGLSDLRIVGLGMRGDAGQMHRS